MPDLRAMRGLAAALVGLLALGTPGLATQATLVTPPAPLSMTGLGAFLNGALLSVGSCQFGTSAPANGPGSAPFSGECWIDSSGSPWLVKRYDGTSWVITGQIDATAHTFQPYGSALILTGSTNGSTRLQAAATATGTLSLPAPATVDTLVARNSTDTLTNKAFDTAAAGNSLLINGLAATANTGTGAVVRATSPTLATPTISGGTVSGAGFSAGAVTSSAIGNTNTVVLTDNNFTLQSQADNAKQAVFSLSGLSTATTRTYTLPNISDTLVALTATQTLTNKTLTAPVLTTPNIGAASGTSLNLNGSPSQYSGLLSVRSCGAGIEFGHTNTSGYGSTIAADCADGRPYLAFNAGPGSSTANSFHTLGLKGAVIQADLLGGIAVGVVPNANADNQLLVPTWVFAATGGHYAAGATGGDQGVGTINASGLFISGVAAITAGSPAALTNKTFDTAGAGNVLKINGTQLSAVTGSGAAVLSNSPTLTSPALSGPAVTGVANVQGALQLSTESTPPQLTASQNNYNPGGVNCATSTTLIVSASTPVNITGLGGGVVGCIMVLINNGTNTITLKNQSTSSAVGNQFNLGADFALAANFAVTLKYDATDSFWRQIGGPSTAGAGSGTLTSVVCGNTTITTNGTCYSDGQLNGTSTNDNALAGNIGEYVASNCPFVTGTVTITIASPAVVTFLGHGFTGICPVVFGTSGSLPTGITTGTTYWTIPFSITPNTFQIATSIANATAGTAVSTSGSQTGTQSGTGGRPLANNAAADVSAVSVTAGDWDCTGNVGTAFSSSLRSHTGWMSTVSQTDPAFPNNGAYAQIGFDTPQTNFNQFLSVGTFRVSVATATTVYLSVRDFFSGGTDTGLGAIACRRRR
jgi:hypothetical protein